MVPPWLSEDTQHLIQQRNDLPGRPAAVEQTHDRAEQVAEKIPRTRDRNDVENDLIQVYLEPEKIEVERSQYQVQDVAHLHRRDVAWGGARSWSCAGIRPDERHRDLRHERLCRTAGNSARHRTYHGAHRENLILNVCETQNGECPCHSLNGPIRSRRGACDRRRQPGGGASLCMGD
jgi:hypothetical protein